MHRPILRPAPLQPGDTIGIFTPSAPANVRFREKYLHGVEGIRALGFDVIEGPLTARCGDEGYRSGSAPERAAELMWLIEQPAVRGVIATIGGMNSSSLIPYLDFEAIRSNPKVVCGYSDVTALHLAILAYSGVSTFYGPAVMPSFGEWPAILPETRESFLDAVNRHREGRRELVPPKRWSNHFRDAATDAWRTEPRRFQSNPGWATLSPGAASAPAIIANLNTLVAQAGTDHFPDLNDRILVIEEMSAPWDLQERSLRALELLGVFNEICGLVVGKPEFPNPQGAPFDYHALLREIVGERSYPIVGNFDCGHTVPMLTLAQLTRLSINAVEGGTARLTIEEPMVAV